MQRGEPKRNVNAREVRRRGNDSPCPRRRWGRLDDGVMYPKAVIREGMIPSDAPSNLSGALTTRLEELRDAKVDAGIRGMVVWRAKVRRVPSAFRFHRRWLRGVTWHSGDTIGLECGRPGIDGRSQVPRDWRGAHRPGRGGPRHHEIMPAEQIVSKAGG